MKFKRGLALLLMGITVLGTASCGTEKKADDVPTLTWYMQGDEPKDMLAVEEAANEILVPAIGAKLDMVYIDAAAYTERMNMNMASGDAFDLCFVGYINKFLNAVENGGLLAIDEYLEDCTKLKEALPEYVFEAGKYEGETYAIPNWQISASSYALYIYKDLADEYGLNLDEIKTLYDIEPFLAWVKETHPDIFPFQSGGGGGFDGKDVKSNYMEIVNGIGAVLNEDGTLTAVNNMDRENADREAKLMRDWYEKGYIRQDISTVTSQADDEKAGRYACWRATYKPGANEEYQAVRNREVVSVQISNAQLSEAMIRNTMIGVGANSKHPEKAVKFIEEINTNPDLYNLIAFGIEGKHYTLEDGYVQYKEDSLYNPGMTWRFGNQFNAYLLPGQSKDTWEQTIKFNEEADKTPLFGFAFNSDRVKTEMAQLSQIYSKYPSLKTGAEPVESYWERMKQELENANIDKVVAEAQRQIDEFLADKQ